MYNRSSCAILVGCDGVPEARLPFQSIPRNTQSIYGELSRMALVEHVLCCLAVDNNGEHPEERQEDADEAAAAAPPLQTILSCRVSRDGLQSIHDLCGPSGQLQNANIPWLDVSAEGQLALSTSIVGSWADRQRRGGHLFMSVVNLNISSLKRAFKSSSKLQKSDISVNIHRVLEVDRPRILLDSGSVNIEGVEAGSGFEPSMSLVLSLSALDMEALESIRQFEVQGQLQCRIDVSKLNGVPPSCNDSVVKAVSAYLAWGEAIEAAVQVPAMALLECLRAEGLVQHRQGRERFKIDGSEAVRTGWWISEAAKLSRCRDLQLLECSRHELMQRLEADNWSFGWVRKRKKLPGPYQDGDAKKWFTIYSKSFVEKGKRLYVCIACMCLSLSLHMYVPTS